MTNLRVPTLHVPLLPHHTWKHVWPMRSSGPRNILSAVYFHIWKKELYKKMFPDNLFLKNNVLWCFGEKGSSNRTDVNTFCVNHSQCLAIYLSICLLVCLSIYLSIYLSIGLVFLFIFELSIYLFIDFFICLSFYWTSLIHLSTCLLSKMFFFALR